MTSQLARDFERLKSKNQQLWLENERLRAENQAAKEREDDHRKEFTMIRAELYRRDRERLDRLMLKDQGKPEAWVYRQTVLSYINPGTSQADDLVVCTRLSLPLEIIDQVIDHLYDDRRALKACALACRAWVHPSRYHLFSNLDISLIPRNPPQTFDALIGHLDHPLCTFTSAVRKLSIRASTSERPFQLVRGWLDPLIPHLPKLVSVTSLVAQEVVGWGMSTSWKTLLKSHSFTAQITHLLLKNHWFQSFEQCMETICSFPSLVHLEYNVESQYDREWTLSLPAFRSSPPPPLRVLEITSWHTTSSTLQLPWSQLMWKWLHRSETRLSTIRLGSLLISADDDAAGKLHSFAQYLQFLGPSLEVLQVGFHDVLSIFLFLSSVDVNLNTRLRVLELGSAFHFDLEVQSFDARFAALPSLLSRIPTAALTTIKFEFWCYTLAEPEFLVPVLNPDATWTDIDDLLAGPSFPALNEVAFRVFHRPPSFYFDVTTYLEQKLPRCRQKSLSIPIYD